MATLVTCYKCKKSVPIKKTALCSVCHNRFELDCDGYPEATYRLMNQESKNKWRCKTCVRNKKTASTNNTSNMTLRKNPIPKKIYSPIQIVHNTKAKQQDTALNCTRSQTKNTSDTMDSHILSDFETSDESYTTPNKPSQDLDGTISQLILTSEMKDTIALLTQKLERTENKLKHTSLLNTDLHKQIEIFKTRCSCTYLREQTVNLAEENKQSLPHLIHVSPIPCTPISSKSLKETSNNDILGLQQKITNLHQQLKVAEREINNSEESH